MTDSAAPRDLFSRSGGNRLILFVVCALILTIPMAPLGWSSNEINYFDLAYRQVRPDLYGPEHSVFDASQGRFLSFWIIGSVIDGIGFEAAKTLLGLVSIGIYALALAGLSAVLGLGPVAVAVALTVYLLQQSLLGGEWLFGTVEAKVFAYSAAVLGIAAAVRDRWHTAIILLALGTMFHFLIGGFWGAAVLFLHALSRRDWRTTLRLFALFSVLVLPLVLLLARERLGTDVDMTGLDRSLANIYSEYRGSHHIAPFDEGMKSFILGWFPGLVVHIGLGLALVLMRGDFGRLSAFVIWVAGLNAYIAVAIVVAFIDRHTHVLASFYIFRPSALILLLSILLVVWRLGCGLGTYTRQKLSLPAAVLIAAILGPAYALNIAKLAFITPIDKRIVIAMTAPERGVLDWLLEHSGAGDMVLMQPASGDGTKSEGLAFPGGLERLTHAAFYVNYKFVPSARADVAEWYRRLQTRRAIFAGDCKLLDRLGPDFLIMNAASGDYPLQPCTETVYRNDGYMIVKPKAP